MMKQFVCVPNISKSYKHILNEIFGGVGRDPRNKRLDSGGDPDPRTYFAPIFHARNAFSANGWA